MLFAGTRILTFIHGRKISGQGSFLEVSFQKTSRLSSLVNGQYLLCLSDLLALLNGKNGP